MTPEQQLKVISKAWGRNQKGYCFFPWIDREAQRKAGRRRAGYHEGEAFYWPKDRDKILQHMRQHQEHDLYWCPNLFEYDARREDVAMDEHALWADLDEVDPTQIEDYPPTIAWQTSPGRYQALWIIGAGDAQGASWPGNENQRLTYHLGADLGGWDTTQLLRIPGWKNHKYEEEPEGKLLWQDGRTWLSDEFDELPAVQGALPQGTLVTVLEKEIDAVDRTAVLARVKLKLNHRARELLASKIASADRSDNLWYLERCLADAGCSIAEIVAVVRPTVWNKFDDRADELKTLINEASKAIAKRSEEVQEELEEEAERAPLVRMALAFRDIQPPEWLIDGVLTENAVGFIAGQPKSYKSWVGLDMAISVATGADFLGHFKVRNPGPVLYIQEEDPIITLKQRAMKIWKGKQVDRLRVTEQGVEWEPGSDLKNFDPDINMYVKQNFTISEDTWQVWLDEMLAQGMNGKPYRLLTIDTLMRVAGAVDENRAVEMMTKVYRPLSTLSAKHKVAIQVVNHMRKSNKNDGGERGGQLMLGSVANHAWSEDSVYLHHDPKADGVVIDYESKTAPGARYQMSNLRNAVWEPALSIIEQSDSNEPIDSTKHRSRKGSAVVVMLSSTPKSVSVLAKAAGVTYQSARQQLIRAETKGLAVKTADNLWILPA
jgi:hypothetical protein